MKHALTQMQYRFAVIHETLSTIQSMADFPPESLQSKTTFYLKHIEYKKEKIRSLNISGPKPAFSGWFDSSLFKVGSGPGFYARSDPGPVRTDPKP